METRRVELVVSLKIPFVFHYIPLQPSVRRQCDPRVAQWESTRAAFFRHLDSLEKAGIEETDPYWDEEHCHSGINDSAMHLIIIYTTGPRSE